MKNVEIFNGNWSVDLVKKSTKKIWIFGDNDQRIGNGGQATIRPLSNSFGIRTKKRPSTTEDSYYSDNEYEENCKKITEDVVHIMSKWTQGYTIVFSSNGYGTGLALLKDKAPLTFQFLCDVLKQNFEFDNQNGSKWQKIPSIFDIESGEYVNFHKQNEKIIFPINNSFFIEDLLKNGYTNYFDAIINQKKVAFTSEDCYKNGQIILLRIPGEKEYLIVRVNIDSYDIPDYKTWSLLEGFNYDVENIDSKYKQTLFSYICRLRENGQITFRDDFFSSEIPKQSIVENIEEKVDVESNILNDILTQLREINIKLDKLNEKNQ